MHDYTYGVGVVAYSSEGAWGYRQRLSCELAMVKHKLDRCTGNGG